MSTRTDSSTFLQRNALSLVLIALFASSLIGQIAAGRVVYNRDLAEHALPAVGWLEYLGRGQFISATFENWESEFLQMGLYVLLTVVLRQKGSAESRPLQDSGEETIEPGTTPWPVRRGGIWLTLYRHSLSAALLALFVIAFVMHWFGSWDQEVERSLLEGKMPPGCWEHLFGAQFWFESFQNWQSEFMVVAVLVLAAVWLRQRGSGESKPVAAPHSETPS